MTQLLTLCSQALRTTNLFTGGDTYQGASTTGSETIDNDGGAGGNPLVVILTENNPFGFLNIAELKGDAAVADPTLVFTRQLVGTFPANGTWTVYSTFVKRPTTGTPMSGFVMDIKTENHGLQSHKAGFKWVGTELQRDTTQDGFNTSDTNFKVAISQYANGWYRVRVAYMVSTRGGDTTIVGDSRRMYIKGVDADLSNKNLWLFGQLLEEKTDFEASHYFSSMGVTEIQPKLFDNFDASSGRVQISVVPGQAISVQLWARLSPSQPWVQVLAKTQADLNATTGTAIFPVEIEPFMLLQFGVDIPVGALPTVCLAVG